MLLLKTEYKFFYLFHDVATLYSKIFAYFNDYIQTAKSKDDTDNSRRLKNIVMDVMGLLLDSMIVLCDNREGFSNYSKYDVNNLVIEENVNNYDIVEEMPSKIQILTILKEIKVFFQIEGSSDIRYLNLTNKSVILLKKLSQNFFGQIMLLYGDYPSALPKDGKPFVTINKLINDLSLVPPHGILIDVIENLVVTIVLLFYDLNYYEQNGKEVDNVFTHSNTKKVTITESRLNALQQFIGDADSQENPVQTLQKLFTALASIPEKTEKTERISSYVQTLIQIITGSENTIITSESYLKTIKLPHTRKIYDKCELIHKYYEFYHTQGYGFNLPYQSTTTSSSSNISYVTYINKYNDYHKQHISEFEKLLNWKKYRIYLTKMDYLEPRRSIFELDIGAKYKDEKALGLRFQNMTLAYRKSNNYINHDPFEQFCNQLMNEELVVSRYHNLSYSVSSTVLHKLFEYVIQPVYKYDLEFNRKNIYNKVVMKGGQKITRKSKIVITLEKKINSKLNMFVYKPKYEKMPKTTPFVFPNPVLPNQTSKFVYNTIVPVRDNRAQSIVSGRLLSEHVDKFAPNQAIVNTTYAGDVQMDTDIEKIDNTGMVVESEVMKEAIKPPMVPQQSNFSNMVIPMTGQQPGMQPNQMSGMGHGMGSGMGHGMGSGMGHGMGSGMGHAMGSGMSHAMGSGMSHGTSQQIPTQMPPNNPYIMFPGMGGGHPMGNMPPQHVNPNLMMNNPMFAKQIPPMTNPQFKMPPSNIMPPTDNRQDDKKSKMDEVANTLHLANLLSDPNVQQQLKNIKSNPALSNPALSTVFNMLSNLSKDSQQDKSKDPRVRKKK
jgi:hypothetical protein